jgi:hypothetical protein
MTTDNTYYEQVKAAMDECDTIDLSHAEAAEADAGFDGGEFSGPASDRMRVAALEACAQRHGFPDYNHLESEADRLGFGPHTPGASCPAEEHQWVREITDTETGTYMECCRLCDATRVPAPPKPRKRI